jgi:hypothetical protein
MRRPRFTLADLCVITSIIAIDCVALRMAILDRESVLTIRGVFLMTNAVAFGLYRLLMSRGNRDPFLTGFVVTGLLVNLVYFDCCQLFYSSMLRTQKWMLSPIGVDACHIHFIDVPNLGMTGQLTARTVLLSVALTPVVVSLISLPQMFLALGGGLLARRFNRLRVADIGVGA